MFSKWNYTVQNNAEKSETVDVHIDGQIVDADTETIFKEWISPNDPSVSFRSFRDKILSSGAKNINVYVNCPGGIVTEAFAMHDFLKSWNRGHVYTEGRGLVASAATYVVSAVPDSNLSENGFYFIHDVSGFFWGNMSACESQLEQMRKMNDHITEFYANLTGISLDEIKDMMKTETLLTAKDAKEKGFVKGIAGPAEAQAIPASNWKYNNKSALTLYNTAVGEFHKHSDSNPNNFALTKSNVMKLADRISNAVNEALKNLGIEVKEDGTAEVTNTIKIEDVVTNVANGINTELQNQINQLTTDLNTAKEANTVAVAAQNDWKTKHDALATQNATLTADLQKALGKEEIPAGGDRKPDDNGQGGSALENWGRGLKGILGV